MKCPYCNYEMDTAGEDICWCENKGCPSKRQTLNEKIVNDLKTGMKAQEALESAKEYFVIARGYGKNIHYISYCTGEEWFWNWKLDHAEPFDCLYDAKHAIKTHELPHAYVLKVRRFTQTITEPKEE